jgi:hypothetical protein
MKRSLQNIREVRNDTPRQITGWLNGDRAADLDRYTAQMEHRIVKRELLRLLGPRKFRLEIPFSDAEHRRAQSKAREGAREHAFKVRALLRGFLGAWLDHDLDAARVMQDEKLRAAMDDHLRRSHPVVDWRPDGESRIYTTTERLSCDPEQEALELFLILLTRAEWNEIKLLRRCQECSKIFLPARKDKEFCSGMCRQKFHRKKPEYRKRARDYMRKHRAVLKEMLHRQKRR